MSQIGDIFQKSAIAQQSVLFEQLQITFYENKQLFGWWGMWQQT